MRIHHSQCQNSEHLLSRRRPLFGSAASSAYLALARRGDAETKAAAGTPRNTAKSCIFINLAGAPSQLDTFDPKDGPWNPSDVDLREIAPRMVLSRTFFPELSRRASDLLVLRSVESWELAHERGNVYLQTGHPSNPAFLAESPHLSTFARKALGVYAGLLPLVILAKACYSAPRPFPWPSARTVC